MQSDELKRRISAGRGDALADLVLKNARIINVFTDEIDTADIAISGNSIVGVGTYHGRKEVDLHGKYVCPGLIDGHIHIESSMLCGPAFEQGNNALALSNGISTFKVAVALAIGISLVLCIPIPKKHG